MRRLAAILIGGLVISAGSTPRAATTGTFLLQVPELQLDVPENTAAPIQTSFLNRLELQVLRSSQEIPPGKIVVRINGEAANTIMTTRAAESTIACDLDLNFRPGFLLHAGRNSIEASAQSIYGRPFYAVFLLDVRGEPESLRDIQRQTKVVKGGEKPPAIHLSSPQGTVENVREVTVSGSIEGGVTPVTVTVQGEKVRVRTAAGSTEERGIQASGGAMSSFSSPVALAKQQESIEIVATDAHGNSTRLLIPVVPGIRVPSQRWAVVIGISHYQNSSISLQFADHDAQAIADFLRDPRGGGVPEANLRVLTNEEATSANIRSALFDFLSKPGPDDLTIVYFAGHGTNDFKNSPDTYYFLSYESDVNKLSTTAVRMTELQEAFEGTVKSNLVTLVDACHSGGIGNVANVTNQRWLKAGFGAHRAIITASEIDETSSEGSQWGGGHGVFTYYILQGLQGAADIKHDHRITVGELFDFVGPHVRQATNNAQTPSAQAGSERGLVLTQTESRTAAYQPGWVPFVVGGEAR